MRNQMRKFLLIGMIGLIAASAPALGQEKPAAAEGQPLILMRDPPWQPEDEPEADENRPLIETRTDESGNTVKIDRSGHSAVLCSWALYMSAQIATTVCKKPRTPTDDAIDQAIVDIDQFIIANSSEHPTQADLDKLKSRMMGDTSPEQIEKYCSQPDLTIDTIRSTSPDKVRANVKHLLAIPREPVMNPCL
ncbi:MAG: hypothetical protein LBV44_08525 [Methylobacillus sp.]|jgi:hypothetical protein|nr:hypothetical protein [Methylobacillus sp.]